MINTLKKALVAFLALTGLAYLARQFLHIELGSSDFWQHHGIFFLIFVSFFPRLTLLFSSVVSGGLIWWLCWLVVPRILVAILATLAYWNQNPGLVIIAWLVALSGESSEKVIIVRRSKIRHRKAASHAKGDVIDVIPESSTRE